jgi:hypothetical protein
MISVERSSVGAGRTIPALQNLPARLSVEETAQVLGFQPHDIPVLVAAKLLVPLGDPAPNAPKFFAKVSVAERADTVQWLHKATKAVSSYWKGKRSRATLV